MKDNGFWHSFNCKQLAIGKSFAKSLQILTKSGFSAKILWI